MCNMFDQFYTRSSRIIKEGQILLIGGIYGKHQIQAPTYG